jgi:hypothetical protein
MRPSSPTSAKLVAVALAAIGTLASLPGSLLAQATPEVVPAPYKPIPITLPRVVDDPAFEAFRKQLADAAQKKDRTALAALIAANFFWVPEDTDLADPNKSGIENLAKAMGLDQPGAPGWERLANFAAERSGIPDPQRQGVLCAPAEPDYDERALDDLADATHTDASDWVYPVRDGVEVRSGREQSAPIVEKLGLHLVRVLPDDSAANAVFLTTAKVMTPSGKLGFVPTDTIKPLIGEQLCYAKPGGSWKIAGFLGGDPSQ